MKTKKYYLLIGVIVTIILFLCSIPFMYIHYLKNIFANVIGMQILDIGSYNQLVARFILLTLIISLSVYVADKKWKE